MPYKFDTTAGTTDYVDYMGNNRTSYFWISGNGLFGSETKVDIYLRTNDGVNAASFIFDVVRAVATSLDRRSFGSPSEISNYGFKKLRNPVPLQEAHRKFFEKYVR